MIPLCLNHIIILQMFGKPLYQYLGCRQDFATIPLVEQGLCERECTPPLNTPILIAPLGYLPALFFSFCIDRVGLLPIIILLLTFVLLGGSEWWWWWGGGSLLVSLEDYRFFFNFFNSFCMTRGWSYYGMYRDFGIFFLFLSNAL